MLNARLYRTSWLVAGVALVIAPLTLRSTGGLPGPATQPIFDAAPVERSLQQLGGLANASADRSPGSPGDAVIADWVQQRFAELGATTGRARDRVRTQDFVVRTSAGGVRLRNVFLAEPGRGQGRGRAALLVVAPRDAPPGVSGGLSGTALLVELARLSRTTSNDRPIFFVSTSGSTLGNAGVRWFLRQFSNVRIASAIVLDAPGETVGTGFDLWTDGTTPRSAVTLRQLTASAVGRLGGRASRPPALWVQLARKAVPQSIGEQGPLVDAGIPAVTLAARPESPLANGTTAPNAERIALVGRVSQGLLASFDQSTTLPAPATALIMTGRLMRPSVVRLALLLTLLPALVMAVDVLARLRRARIFLGRGLRALRWRFVAPLATLGAAYAVSLVGILPEGVAGRPPLSSDAGFNATDAVGVVLVAAIAPLVWRLARRRVASAQALPPTDAAAALVVACGLALTMWWFQPFTLVLVVPALHAAIIATMVRGPWPRVALAVAAVLPAALAVAALGDLIGRGLGFSTWYTLATVAAGTRGWFGPVSVVLMGVCLWTFAVPTLRRGRPARRSTAPGGAPARDRPRARRARV